VPRTHPHAEASYRIFRLDDESSFGVEVSIPDSYPTRVSLFKTRADAEAWIAEHRRRVESQTHGGHRFRRANSRGR